MLTRLLLQLTGSNLAPCKHTHTHRYITQTMMNKIPITCKFSTAHNTCCSYVYYIVAGISLSWGLSGLSLYLSGTESKWHTPPHPHPHPQPLSMSQSFRSYTLHKKITKTTFLKTGRLGWRHACFPLETRGGGEEGKKVGGKRRKDGRRLKGKCEEGMVEREEWGEWEGEREMKRKRPLI